METLIDLTEQYAEVDASRDGAGNVDLVIETEGGDTITLRLNSTILADIFAAIASL